MLAECKYVILKVWCISVKLVKERKDLLSMTNIAKIQSQLHKCTAPPCTPSPSENGGECSEDLSGYTYTCDCPAGWTYLEVDNIVVTRRIAAFFAQ